MSQSNLEISRDDLEPNDGSLFAANEIHDIVELHVDGIDDLAIFLLTDTDDAIQHLEIATLVRRTTDHESLNGGRAVFFRLQHRSDPFEGFVHLDAEIVILRLREILGVRIVGP